VREPVTMSIPGVGEVQFVPSDRARRVNISLCTSGTVRVAVPRHVNLNQAQEFVVHKGHWIRKQKEKLQILREIFEQKMHLQPIMSESRARKFLRQRAAVLAQLYGFSIQRVFVRNQRTRWGSCSGANNINLNIKLAILPEMLRDYVILHELVHTRIKNHGPDFWHELDRYVGNAKALRKRLKNIPLGE
jgi:predicted metal-dependent hydrolase